MRTKTPGESQPGILSGQIRKAKLCRHHHKVITHPRGKHATSVRESQQDLSAGALLVYRVYLRHKASFVK